MSSNDVRAAYSPVEVVGPPPRLTLPVVQEEREEDPRPGGAGAAARAGDPVRIGPEEAPSAAGANPLLRSRLVRAGTPSGLSHPFWASSVLLL